MKTIGLIAGALLLATGGIASAESRLAEGVDIARACAGDVRKLCADVGLRDVKACIKDKLTELSAPCFDAILTAVTAGKEAPPDDSATAQVQRFDGLRGMRYCEIFLISGDPATEALTANFFNTSDLNNQADPKDTCPAEMWAKVDPKSLEAQYAVIGVFKNGPRGWANDWIELPAGEVRTFDGLEARWMGNVNLPKDFGKKGATAYHPTQVHRNSSMTFEKGKPVFILDDPDGTPWVMQAYSAIVDPNLTYDDLETLATKLKPAAGWSYRVKVLDEDLTIKAVNGIAHIVQDDLENTYDACFETACTSKP